MVEPTPGYEIVLETRHRRELMESRLVLEAAGITAQSVSANGRWMLLVAPDDVANSAAELEAYRHENPVISTEARPAAALYGGAATAVLAYAVTILLTYLLSARSAFGFAWLPAGEMQAGRVMAGEWWRTVTALTLHADAGHLNGNLLFGALFGFLAGQALGGGVAWLVILVAGGLGNLVNAVVQTPEHTSIGASTAVFAALGVIVAHALRPRESAQEKLLKRWSPLIGGVLLLAFLGVGDERTDVVAHATGFLAGLLVGWVGCRFPPPWLAKFGIQLAAGLLAFAIIISAWSLALVAGS